MFVPNHSSNNSNHIHMDKQQLETLYEGLMEFQAQAPYEMGSTEDRTLTSAIRLVEDALFPDLD